MSGGQRPRLLQKIWAKNTCPLKDLLNFIKTYKKLSLGEDNLSPCVERSHYVTPQNFLELGPGELELIFFKDF